MSPIMKALKRLEVGMIDEVKQVRAEVGAMGERSKSLEALVGSKTDVDLSQVVEEISKLRGASDGLQVLESFSDVRSSATLPKIVAYALVRARECVCVCLPCWSLLLSLSFLFSLPCSLDGGRSPVRCWRLHLLSCIASADCLRQFNCTDS